MYQHFNIIDFTTDLIGQTLTLSFNYDVDPDTITKRNIKLVDDVTDSIVPVTMTTDRDTVVLTLLDTPVPNQDYLLICSKNIQSVTGETIYNSLIKNIQFKSSIRNTIDLIQPSELQKVSDMTIIWKEILIAADSPAYNRYRIQIAKENAFYNITHDTVVEGKNQITLKDPVEPGQYYIRMRVESETEYGPWCGPISFLFQEKTDEEKDVTTGDTGGGQEIPNSAVLDTDPVIFSNLELISRPDNGETPENFTFVFDSPINEEKLTKDMIVVTRKDF